MGPLDGLSTDAAVPAVKGDNTAGGDGVVGTGRRGVVGESEGFQGVFGKSVDNAGVVGASENFHAVFGISHGSNNGGVIGINVSTDGKEQGFGVIGRGKIGVTGESHAFQGVLGTSIDNAGIVGDSKHFHAVFGISHSVNNGGVFGANDSGGFGVIGVSNNGIGVSGKGGRLAGLFEGRVEVTELLTVHGINVIDLLEQLQKRIAELEASRFTNFGAPVHSPVATRPNITVQQELGGVRGEEGFFSIFGGGFLRGTPIVIKIFNPRRGQQPETASTFSDLGGSLPAPTPVRISCQPGDRLKFVASDQRQDLSDLTTFLWSSPVDILVI